MHFEDHPIAAIFPLLPDAELKELAADIEAQGLLQPILLHEGKILDGRNRYRACQMAGVTPDTETYSGSDPLKDTLSLNLRRRHLSESQRAMVAAKLASLPVGTNQHASIEAPTQNEAADQLQVSRASVQRARQVIEKSPDLAEQVAAGTITVHAAQKAIADAAEPTKAPLPPVQIDAAERIWATAKSQLDKITARDISRERVLREVVAYCEARIDSRH